MHRKVHINLPAAEKLIRELEVSHWQVQTDIFLESGSPSATYPFEFSAANLFKIMWHPNNALYCPKIKYWH